MSPAGIVVVREQAAPLPPESDHGCRRRIGAGDIVPDG
jgi:hypothetical protein